jgi:hypothetical protein
MSTYRKFSSRFAGDKPKTFASFATFTGGGQNFEAETDTDRTQIETPKIQSASVKVAQVAKVATSEAAVCGELPGQYRKVLAALMLKPPAHVPEDRWQRCVEDAKAFVRTWGEQAHSLGWSNRDLFGLHTPPEHPHTSYSRLSRYDETGLLWLLQGRLVIALTETTAAIENKKTKNITVYRKERKPGLGPVGDSLDDFQP